MSGLIPGGTSLASCSTRPANRWSRQAWSQLRSKTKYEVIRLLDKEPDWERIDRHKGTIAFLNRRLPRPGNTIVVHQHSKQRFPPYLLNDILAVANMTEEALKKKKFIR